MAFLDELLKNLAGGVHKIFNPEEPVKNPIYKMQDFQPQDIQPPAPIKQPENTKTFIDSVASNAQQIQEQYNTNIQPQIVSGLNSFNQKAQGFIDTAFSPPPAIVDKALPFYKPAQQIVKGLVSDAVTNLTVGSEDHNLAKEYSSFIRDPEKIKQDPERYKKVTQAMINDNMNMVMGITGAPEAKATKNILQEIGGKAGTEFEKAILKIGESSDTVENMAKSLDDAVRNVVAQAGDNVPFLSGIKKVLEDRFSQITNEPIKKIIAEHVGILDDLTKQVEKAVPQASAASLPLVSDTRLPNMNTSAGGTTLPSDVRASNPLPSGVSDTVTGTPSNVYSPTASVADIKNSPTFQAKYKATIEEKPFLDSLLSDISGDRQFKTATKDITTTAEKIVRKLPTKPEYSENVIGDMLRGNIIAKDATDAQSLLQSLGQKVKVENVENYVDSPTVWGYQGINVNVRTPGGNIAEVQIHTPESIAVQDALHPLYEKWRNEAVIPKEVYEQSKQIADQARLKFQTNKEVPLVDSTRLSSGVSGREPQLPTAGGSSKIPPETPPEGGDITPNIVIDEAGKLRKLNEPNKYQFDLKQLNTPDDVKNTILEMARSANSEVQTARRGTISWEQTRKFADALGMTVDEVIDRKPGKMYNAEELDAATRLALGAAENLTQIQTKVRALREAGQEVPDALRSQLVEATIQLKGIQASVIGARSEAGRLLNSVKMLKDATTITEKTKAEKVIKKIFAGDEKTADKVIEQLGQFDPEDTLGMVKFIQQVKPSTLIDKIEEYWYNSVLSNTATHIVNFTGNTMSTLLRFPEKAVSSMIDTVLTTGGKIAGKPVQRERYMAEIGGELSGVRSGFTKGIQKALYVLKNGLTATDVNKFDVGRGQAIKGPIGDIINIPSKLLVASDEMFKGINFEMGLWEQATRIAKQEGLSGAEFTARVADIVSSPDSKVVSAAMDKAKNRLFQSSSKSADAVRAFRDNLAVINMGRFGEFKPVRFIIPFIQTPANVVKFGLERSPAGFLGTAYKAATGAGKGEVSDSLAKAFIGSSIMVPLSMYFSEDKITGAAPSDPKEADAFYADGKLPYSLKIGDRWVAYNRVEPFNTILTQLAMWHESFKKNGDVVSQETVSEFLRGTVMNLADQTFMTGMGNLINAVEDPKRYGQKFITDILGGFVPSLVAASSRTIDPMVRKPETPVQDLQARIPLVSRDVPARESAFEPGGKAIRKGDLLTQLINNFTGFRSSPSSGTDLLGKVREIKQLNSEAKAISESEKSDALKMLGEIEKTNPEQRGKLIERWVTDGRLDDKAITVMTNALQERALPLKGEESYLKNSPVKTRAKIIYDEIAKIPPDQREAYITRMTESKILTDDVIDALSEYSASQRGSGDLPLYDR